jgi:hypothetical protein
VFIYSLGGPIKSLIPDEMKTIEIRRHEGHFFEVPVKQDQTLVVEFYVSMF